MVFILLSQVQVNSIVVILCGLVQISIHHKGVVRVFV